MRTTETLVLLVDDDEDQLRALAVTFESYGHKVATASSYEGAIELIHDHEDKNIAAFLDMHLNSARTGVDVLKYIKQNAKHRVVPSAWTGDHSILTERTARSAGAQAIFHKGIDSMERLVVFVETTPIWDLIREIEQDPLTGLDNRLGFEKKALSQLIAAKKRGEPSVLSLLSIDIDNFKKINDTHGHDAGDEVLKAIASLLAKNIRPADLLCHKSGDEFLILLPGADEENALKEGLRLQKVVEVSPIFTNVARIFFSISFGFKQVRSEEIDAPSDQLKNLTYWADMDLEKGLIARKKKEGRGRR